MLKFNLLSFGFLAAVAATAQESQYSKMKAAMDEHSLPLVNLTLDKAVVSREYYVNGEIEVADYHRRTKVSSTTVRYDCKVKLHGNTASGFDKKSFAVKLLDENGEDLNANLFGIRDENNWILDAMAVDRIRMRNRVCFDVWNDMSRVPYDTKYGNRNGTMGVFVEVFVNGAYNGLYCMTDKINRKLLGLKKAKANTDGSVVIRGLLYKGQVWNDRTDIYLLSYEEDDVGKTTWNAWELKYPDNYPSADTWQPLMDLIDFCSEETLDDTFRNTYNDYFYKDNLLDYIVFTLALNVGDNAYKNTFLSVVDITGGHRYLLTPWDMDMSLGGHWSGAYNESMASISRYDHIAPFNRLIVQNMDGFKEALSAKWAERCGSSLSVVDVCSRLNYYADMFTTSGAWKREWERWNGNPVQLKESICDEIEYVKDWYVRNHNHLCKQFGTEMSIDRVGTDKKEAVMGVFMLDGRRTTINDRRQTANGIYIENGKKYIVK